MSKWIFHEESKILLYRKMMITNNENLKVKSDKTVLVSIGFILL